MQQAQGLGPASKLELGLFGVFLGFWLGRSPRRVNKSYRDEATSKTLFCSWNWSIIQLFPKPSFDSGAAHNSIDRKTV